MRKIPNRLLLSILIVLLTACAQQGSPPPTSSADIFFRIAPELNVAPIANDAALQSLQNEVDAEPGWTPAAVINMLKTMHLTAGEIRYIFDHLNIDWQAQAAYVAQEIMDTAPAGGEGRAYYLMMQEGYTEEEIRAALTAVADS